MCNVNGLSILGWESADTHLLHGDSSNLNQYQTQRWIRQFEEKWAVQHQSCQIALFWERGLSYQHFLTDNPRGIWAMLL